MPKNAEKNLQKCPKIGKEKSKIWKNRENVEKR